MQYSKYILFCLILLVLIPSISLAINPQLTSYLKVEIVQKGGVEVIGELDSLTLNVSMPQEDKFQKIENIEINGPYEFITDDLGNKFIKFSWNNINENVDFEIKSIVSIERRNIASLPFIEGFTKPTELIQSDDPEIIKLAESITLGKKTAFDKIASATKWVHENIEYDLKYGEVNNSAKKTLELKSGVCDEFSNVLIAINRALGYRSAYVVGYAYGRGYTEAEDFVPHGWTEICYGSVCYPADPTWAEAGYLDASHIKFARLSDNFFPETSASAKGIKGSNMILKPTDVSIEILDIKEDPIIESKSELLENDLWNGYAVLKTSLETPNCILTKVKSSSCETRGREFLKTETPEEVIYFCKSRNLFSIFKIPELEEIMRYTCQVSTLPFFGKQTFDVLSISPIKETTEEMKFSIDKTTVYSEETFIVEASDSHIFTSYGDYSENKGIFKAPNSDFKVYIYKQGLLDEQEMEVVKEKPFEIGLFLPENITIGETKEITIKIRNKITEDHEIKIKLNKQEANIDLKSMQEQTLKLDFTPSSINDNTVQVFAFTEDFSTSNSKKINVIEPEKTLIEMIIEFINNFFKK